jgi:putative transposase
MHTPGPQRCVPSTQPQFVVFAMIVAHAPPPNVPGMPLPQRRTANLRWGRNSCAGSTYFLTLCMQHRAPVFANPAAAAVATKTLRVLQDVGDVEMLAGTVMPDHVHALFTLGRRLRLGQVMGKFKTLVRKQGTEAWKWQEDGFEHEVRAGDLIEDFGFYIFMNPYRAGLVGLHERWPYWFCPDPIRFFFLSLLGDKEAVPAGWIEKSVQTRAILR